MIPEGSLPGSAVCLLSLGTYAYDERAMQQLVQWQKDTRLNLCFVVLDELEQVNASTLGINARSIEQFKALVSGTNWAGPTSLLSATELSNTARYREIYSRLFTRYQEDRSFRNMVRSQTFKSLHHKLHILGIRNQRHHTVFELGRYLVAEIALLAFVQERGVIEEVGFHARGEAARKLIDEGLALPKFNHMGGGAQVPCLSLESVQIRIPQSQRTIGPITAQVTGGKILGVIGPNGSGKSTLLRAIAGHMPIASGSVVLNGVDVSREAPYARRVATVFQDAGLVGSLTAAGNIKLGASVGKHRKGTTRDDATLLIRAFDMSQPLDSPAADLSMGERQIVALIRAVVSHPQVLLLDEPTASLDTSRRRVLASVIREIVTEQRVPTIIVSHDTDFLFQIADDLLALDAEGTVAAQGRAGDFVSGGHSLVAANLIGVDNVLRITRADAEKVVLDDWLELPGEVVKPPERATGLRIGPEAVAIRDVVTGDSDGTRGILAIRGTIRARQYLSHGDFIMFEPLQPPGAAERIGRARGLMLPPSASHELKKMHVELLIDQTKFTWLD